LLLMKAGSEQMKEKADKARRDSLIDEYRQYVDNVVRNLIRSMGLPLEKYDEFLSAGYLGLVESARKFDFERERSFKRYAFLRIRGAVVDSIRQSSELSASAYRYARALKAVNDLREEDLLSGGADEIESRFGVTAEERLARILDYASQGALAYRLLSADLENDSVMTDTESLSPEEAVQSKEERQQLQDLLDGLPDKERYVIQEYYFNEKSCGEIAADNGEMSKSWVSRIHSKAIKRMRSRYIQAEVNEGI